jgi:hypothetical protein
MRKERKMGIGKEEKRKDRRDEIGEEGKGNRNID